MKSWIAPVAFLLSAASALAGGPTMAPFSADMVMTSGGQAMTGKIYVDGDRTRMEMAAAGQAMVTIVRKDKNVAWMLMPEQKMYMEMPIAQNADAASPFDGQTRFQYTLVGPDTVGGHPCKKYKFEATVHGQKLTGFHWLATDLKDLPIKWSDDAGKTSTELRNVKLGTPGSALFELPAGFAPMKIPGMPGMSGAGAMPDLSQFPGLRD